MTRLLRLRAALLLCATLWSTMVICEEHAPTSYEGEYPTREMAFVSIMCPTNVLVALPAGACTVTLDLEEPTSNCGIVSITNDFNNDTSIPSQEFGPGSINIIWTIEDCDGITMCTQTVTVFDDTAPIFICPAAEMQMCSATDMTPFATVQDLIDAGATIMDNCEVDMDFLEVGDLVEINEGPCPAEYERSYTIRDVSGNTATCMHSIIVEDMTAPEITCPDNVTVSTDDAACIAQIEVPAIMATDNCGSVTLTNDIAPSGTMFDFPIGQTPITYTATDDCGNMSTCATFINVVDTELPTISCPEDLTASCSADEQTPYADFASFVSAGGNAMDNCEIDESSFQWIADAPQGTACPLTVERTYQIADASGNIATCTQNIIVSESEAPTFTVPVDITLDCGVDLNDTAITGTPSNAMDNCGAADITFSSTDTDVPTVLCPTVQTITRAWTATDACGNTSEPQIQTIVVQDTTAPTVVCQDLTLYLNEEGNVTFTAADLDGGSTDDCGQPLTFTSNFVFASCNDITTFTDIVLRAEDACGNIDSCTTSVTILDTLNPILTAPSNLTVSCPTDVPATFDNYIDFNNAGGSFEDNCATDLPSLFILQSETPPGTVCPYDIVRTYYAEDNNGNGDTAVHTITVDDTTLPTFTCPSDMTITGTMTTCDTMLMITPLEAMDDCGIASISNNITGESADASATYPGGITEVVYTVTDNCGNSATCSFNITVNVDPAFTCPEDITVDCDLSGYPAAANFAQFMALGGSANLGCDVDTNTFTHVEDILISTNTCTQVIDRVYSVEGSMDMFTCTQRVTATDTELPTISCPATININSEIDQCGAMVTLEPMAVDDNCGIASVTNSFSGEMSAFFPVGSTTVTLTATDNCGNTATCEVEVRVNDAQAPEITCPEPTTAMCDPSMIETYMTLAAFEAAGGTVSDNCQIDESSFEFISEGNITIFGMTFFGREYGIKDIYGNEVTCFHTILVMDSTVPSISCPDDITVDAAATECSANVQLVATSDDNCGTDNLSHDSPYSIQTGGNASGEYPVGTTIVTFTATDLDGNTNTCQVSVTVQDITDPTLSCASTITGDCSIDNVPAYSIFEAFEDDGGAATDFCGIDSTSLTLVSQTGPVGNCPKVYTRTYSISDNNGNSSTCQQTVEIYDNEVPSITCPANITVGTDEGVCEANVAVILTNYTDYCGIETVSNSINANGADATAVYPLGTSSVTFTVLDSCGQMADCTVMVSVEDQEAPVLSWGTGVAGPQQEAMCSASEVALIDFAAFESNGGTVTDNCAVNETTFAHLEDNVVVGSDPSTVIRLYTIEDEAGNIDTIEQTIIIADTENPELTIPEDITISCEDDINEPSLTGTASATDNCDNDPTVSSVDESTVLTCINDSLVLRIFTAMDDAGNVAIDTQRITVLDETAPVITFTSDLLSDIPTTITDTIECGDTFPAPETVQVTDACSSVTTTIDTLYVPNVCAGYPVVYEYVAMDACGNADTAYSAFFVRRDTMAPLVLTHQDTVELTTDDDSCSATATVPAPTVSDNCSDVAISNSIDGKDELTYEFPLGETTFSYTITDDCGNMTVVDQTVIVEDDESPTITCKSSPEIVALSSDQSIAYASSFYGEVDDNCGISSVEVRKLVDACGVSENLVYGDSLFFCCAEIGDTIDIEVRVTDGSGLTNVCVTKATIVDNVDPTLMIPVPDITVSCDFPMDLENMDQFGTFVEISETRSDIIVNDELYASTDYIAGQDGVYKDNCPDGAVVTYTVMDQRVNGQGNIFRVFTITDASGNTETYTQRISVTDTNPFTYDDITWPEDVTIEGCEDDIPTVQEGGFPTFTNINACHDIQYTHSDLVFDSPNSGCVYVRRTFKVINTFEYDPNDSASGGVWTKIQNIFMDNNVAPEFTPGICADTTICAQGSGCSALVELSTSATDDCTATEDLIYLYTIDVNNDGTVDISGEGNTISQMLDQGTHSVTWKVKDRCTNHETCTQLVTVRECKLPTPICLSVAADLSPGTGEMTIWASDFDAGSFDNCTDKENLIFSFSSDVTDFGRTYTCDSIGIREVQMWVTDEAGNQDFCVATIEVQDNTNYCGNSNIVESSNFSGIIMTTQETPLANTKVIVEGPEMELELMTDENGGYVFNEIPMYNDYTIKPEKDDQHLEGVSTMDVVLIQRHILGMEEFDSPYKIIAADVNDNEVITVSDVLELRKLVLGIQSDFNSNNSFRFVNSDYEFYEADDPFPYEEEADLEAVENEQIVTDFVAVKIGDVNGSFEEGLTSEQVETRSDNALRLYTEDQKLTAGEFISVPVFAKDLNSLYAMQFTMEYDRDILVYHDFESGIMNISEEQIAQHGNALTLAWGSQEAIASIPSDQALLYLTFGVKQESKLSKVLQITSGITPAWTYDASQTRYETVLRFGGKQVSDFTVLQNKPNPFTEYTDIVFELPKTAHVSVTVYDNNGKLVHRQADTYEAGSNQIRINTDQLNGAGVYYYKIQTGNYTETRKMLKIQ